MLELKPHQTRMVEELRQLQEKTTALDTFMKSDSFGKLDVVERILLTDQRKGMEMYREALSSRVKRVYP